MRILGLDLGTKTLGVAISDNLGLIASKYDTIRFNDGDYDDALNKLMKIVEEFNITTVVLGLPKNMDNTLGFASERSLNFKEKLETKNLTVILQDERLSTKSATDMLISGNVSRKDRKKVVDAVAATIILQTYLNKERVK